MTSESLTTRPARASHVAKFIVFSLIGIAMFFIPITLNGTSTIPLDHLVTFIRKALGPAVPFYILILLLAGTIMPFATGGWKASKLRMVFAFANVVGLVVGAVLIFGGDRHG